jgi:UDP-glucose 4-epimerase
MRILVAGAAGYLGAWITESLGNAGHEVFALVRRPPLEVNSWTLKNIRIVVGDIREEEVIQELVRLEVDCVIYLISLNHKGSEKNVKKILATNVEPMWRLLEAYAEQGLSRFIYFSTQQVYGALPLQAVDESYFPRPSNYYGLTHLMCEQIAHLIEQRSKTLCINLRLSNGYGAPRFEDTDCWWLVVNDFCRNAFQNGEIHLLSDGTPQRDFIHLQDICRAIEHLISLPKEHITERDFHLGAGATFTIIEIAHLVAKVYKQKYGKGIPVLMPECQNSKDLKKKHQEKKMLYSIERINNLGFEPQVSLEKGILKTFDFLNRRIF